MTDHYLNPVVPENYSNTGTLGDFSIHYQRGPDAERSSESDRAARDFALRHSERIRAAGRWPAYKMATNFETMGIVSYQHTFSPHVVADFRGMVRDNANDFNSNANSTPVEVFQHNWFREGYFKSTATVDHGRNEWKFGVESDNTFLNENFTYIITDPTQFDPSTPSLSVLGDSPGPRAVCVRSGSDPPGKLDNQCRAALGSLSASVEPASGGSTVLDIALLSLRRSGPAFLLRQSVSDAVFREHSAFEFHGRPLRSITVLSSYLSSLPRETTTKWV